VNQAVSHTNHFLPGKFRVLGAKFVGHSSCCFADNFKQPDKREFVSVLDLDCDNIGAGDCHPKERQAGKKK
jgi:hypothetical protein